MSLFEWFGESYFPGEVGSIKKRRKWARNTPRYVVIINLLVSLAMIAGIAILVLKRSETISIQTFVAISIALIIYCLIGLFVNPQPDYNNIGIGGTPIDHPFRISDDINRFLIILRALLWPGFYIARSFLEFAILIRHSGAEDMR